jgi:hypothetical protein
VTETELVLMSLTNEELDDAARYLGLMMDRWRESRRVAEAEGRDRLTELGFHGTEGPIHVILAADLAIIREQAVRGGAEPWEAGMPLEGHPGRTRLRYYQERITLNPDEGVIPRLSEAGVLERVCPGCGENKPLTVRFWIWRESTLAHCCRACETPRSSDVAVAVRRAAIEAEDAASEPVVVEPFTEQELEQPVEVYQL